MQRRQTIERPRRDAARSKRKAATKRQPLAAARRSAPRLTLAKIDTLEQYSSKIEEATPVEMVELERSGVKGTLVKQFSAKLGLPAARIFEVLRIPKATVEKKAAGDEMLTGSGGYAAIGLVKLLGIAQGIVANSTAPEARGFEAGKWLGRWIELPQPALGGRRPADFLDTPSGTELVARLLGSIESGAYQ